MATPVVRMLAVVTAGTADTAVAEEARGTLEYLSVSSTLVPDVGGAGGGRAQGDQ